MQSSLEKKITSTAELRISSSYETVPFFGDELRKMAINLFHTEVSQLYAFSHNSKLVLKRDMPICQGFPPSKTVLSKSVLLF